MDKEKSLIHFLMKQFPDEGSAEQYLVEKRWGGKIICPYCNGNKICKVNAKQPYKCSPCNTKFSVKTNTFMHNSAIPIRCWLLVMFFMAKSKQGISSRELGEILDIRQPTIWSMAQRIRNACTQEGILSGTTEADETHIGGKEKNKHRSQKHKVPKSPVVGIMERNGRVKAKAMIPDKTNVIRFIKENIKPGSKVYTDSSLLYHGLNRLGYHHDSVNHSVGEYVRGEVYTNNIENFWRVVKNTIRGTHHWVSKEYLQKYLDEITFKHNTDDFIGEICQNVSNG